jgi:hypothetical protein
MQLSTIAHSVFNAARRDPEEITYPRVEDNVLFKVYETTEVLDSV